MTFRPDDPVSPSSDVPGDGSADAEATRMPGGPPDAGDPEGTRWKPEPQDPEAAKWRADKKDHSHASVRVA